MKTSKSFLFSVFFALCVLSLFVSCKIEADSVEYESDFELVTRYTYNLASSSTYYVVYEWKCVSAGSSSYKVKDYSVHYFPKSRDEFSGKSGDYLCELVEYRKVVASTSNRKSSDEFTHSSTVLSDGSVITYKIPSGISYMEYYY